MRSPKLGAAISIALLLIYVSTLGQWAILLIANGTTIGVGMGVLVLAFPVMGGWVIFRELKFGLGAERLGRELEANNEWPVFQLELRPSGRPTKESADENFKVFQKQAEENPGDWKSWFALSLAYDAAGDRPRAREAMVKAIAMHRS